MHSSTSIHRFQNTTTRTAIGLSAGLAPAPMGAFPVPDDAVQTITAYAHCNQHGLWHSATIALPPPVPGNGNGGGGGGAWSSGRRRSRAEEL